MLPRLGTYQISAKIKNCSLTCKRTFHARLAIQLIRVVKENDERAVNMVNPLYTKWKYWSKIMQCALNNLNEMLFGGVIIGLLPCQVYPVLFINVYFRWGT